MNIKRIVISKLNALVRRSRWYNEVMFPDCKKFWNHNEYNLDVVNLGSTSAKAAFDYSGLGIKAANWSMAPQTFVGDLAILQNYCSYLKPGATVLIPICPFSSLGGGNDDLPDKYYSVVRPISIPHASLRKKREVNEIRNKPLLYFPFFSLLQGIRHKNDCQVHDLEKDAERWLLAWKKEFSIYDLNNNLSLVNKDRYNDSIKVLNELLDFCTQHSYKPVIVIPPLTTFMSKHFNDEVKKKYIYDFIDDIKPKEIIILDYLSDDRFNNFKFFKNSFLLNETGAKFFSKCVLADLNMI